MLHRGARCFDSCLAVGGAQKQGDEKNEGSCQLLSIIARSIDPAHNGWKVNPACLFVITVQWKNRQGAFMRLSVVGQPGDPNKET